MKSERGKLPACSKLSRSPTASAALDNALLSRKRKKARERLRDSQRGNLKETERERERERERVRRERGYAWWVVVDSISSDDSYIR